MKYTFGKQIGDTAATVRLSAGEKSRMRAALLARMHPEKEKIKSAVKTPMAIPSPIVLGDADMVSPASRQPKGRVKPKIYVAPEPSFGWFSFATFRFVPSALALFLIVGSGVTYAAEGTLPGDTLYPLKVNFTEEVRSAFTFSKESEASWKTRRAERRLEEAEKLAAEGRLTADTSAALAGAIGRHTDDARTTLAEFEEGDETGGAVAIGSKFETALAAHEAILSHIVFTGGGASAESGAEVVETVRAKLGQATTRVRGAHAIEAKTTSLMAVEDASTTEMLSASTAASVGVSAVVASRLRSAAEAQIRSMEKTFEGLSNTADADAKVRIETEIAGVQKLFADGVAANEAGNMEEAARLFDESLSRARKAELFMQAELRLNVNLFRGGSIFYGTGEEDATKGSDDSE